MRKQNIKILCIPVQSQSCLWPLLPCFFGVFKKIYLLNYLAVPDLRGSMQDPSFAACKLLVAIPD